MSDGVLVAAEGPVVTIRFNRPAKRNAVTTAMYARLADTFEALVHDAAVRVVVITGGGGAFTAGNDLADMRAAADLGPGSPPRRFLAAVAVAPQVLVIGVDGPAIGIGTTLLLHADLVYATRAAVFALPFVALGLVPEAASTLLLPSLVGPARAAELMLLGRRLDAEEAERWGLLSGLVDGGQPELDAQLAATAAALAAAPSAALTATRRLLRADRAADVAARLDEDGRLMARLSAGLTDARSG